MQITSINRLLSSSDTLALETSPTVSAQVFEELQQLFPKGEGVQIEMEGKTLLFSNFGWPPADNLIEWIGKCLEQATQGVEVKNEEARKVKDAVIAEYVRISNLPVT